MPVDDDLTQIMDEVDLLFVELRELRASGPHFRIYHRFRKPGTLCAPGEEIATVCLVHRGREFCLPLSLALRILFDYLARHSRLPQSATQIEAGIRADCFYLQHGTAGRNKSISRGISRSYVRVYIERLRSALEIVFGRASSPISSCDVLLSERTVMNEVGYRLKATFNWTHIDT